MLPTEVERRDDRLLMILHYIRTRVSQCPFTRAQNTPHGPFPTPCQRHRGFHAGYQAFSCSARRARYDIIRNGRASATANASVIVHSLAGLAHSEGIFVALCRSALEPPQSSRGQSSSVQSRRRQGNALPMWSLETGQTMGYVAKRRGRRGARTEDRITANESQ